MNSPIVFTFIGSDKPGLVEKMSTTVSEHDGNWLESRMSQLAGYFAGIARVQVANANKDALLQALADLTSEELTISIHEDNSACSQQSNATHSLNLIGNDRPGIVRELSAALTALNINIREMNSQITSAPMTADPLFEANAEIEVPATQDLSELSDRLDEIANALSVDIVLDE